MTEIPSEIALSGEVHTEQAVGPLPPVVNPPLAAPPESPVVLLPLDPAFVTAERIGGWVVTMVLSTIGLGVLVVVWFNFGLVHWVFLCSALAYSLAVAGLIWLAHVFPKLQHAHAGWRLTQNGLDIHRGVWWRSQISVPLARVQHTDVHQGPLLRRFGLAKLIVHTAGTENSAVELAGLSFATAQRLRDALIENRGVIDGV